MAEVRECTGELDGQPIFWREATQPGPSAFAAAGAGDGDGAPVLYLHGVPTSSADWTGFLARTGGLAPDLPGFGRSGKRGDLPYTMAFYDAWLERFLDWRGVDRVRLVVHDWGAVGLLWAQRFPERVERLVVINTVPLVAGYRWHATAALWRTPIAGELLMGLTSRWTLGQASRRFNAKRGRMPADWLDDVHRHFDAGTQRAILRLYRSSGPAALERAGADLERIACPALVVWGDRDVFIPRRFGDRLAERLPAAKALHLADAGHWPWLDRPDLIDTIAEFLDSS